MTLGLFTLGVIVLSVTGGWVIGWAAGYRDAIKDEEQSAW